MTIKFNIKGIQPADDSGGGGSSGGVAKYAIVVDQSGIHTPLVTNNMTLGCYSYNNDYMRLDTQLFKIDNDIIDSATLVLKPFADGGNLLGYEDDGSAVNLKLYALHPDGQSHEALLIFTRPDLTADGTIGGDDFAVAMDSQLDLSRPAWKAFDGNTVLENQYSDQAVTQFGHPHWVEFYNPNPLNVSKIIIFNGADNCLPLAWEFQCSDDNITWTTLTSGTNTELTQNGEWSFVVSNSGWHKYYRFYTISGYGADSDYLGLTEIQIEGVERKTTLVTDYKYVLAKDNTFNLPTGYDGSVLVGKIYLPAHYYNDNGSWEMGTGGEEPADDKTPVLRSLTVTPTTSPQTIMPDNDIDGYAPIYVKAYTEIGIPREVSAEGVYQVPTGEFTFTLPDNATSIAAYALQDTLKTTNVTEVNLNNVKYITTQSALQTMCSSCLKLVTFDISNVEEISGTMALYQVVSSCSLFKNFIATSLKTITGTSALARCFEYGYSLEVLDFPVLDDISGSLVLTLACRYCYKIKDIYFRALKTTSFGSYTDQLKDIFQYTGTQVVHTIHFPSNLESTVQGLTGYPLFGGTADYVVLAFDLPATS